MHTGKFDVLDKKKIVRQQKIKIPELHSYLIKEFQLITTEIQISLVSGSAEIYGMELKKNYPRTFKIPVSVVIFTWQGCQIQVKWRQQENTVNSIGQWKDLSLNNPNSPMLKYLQIHYQLTKLRKLAQEEVKIGPKVAIIGSENSAIINVARLLLNYTGKLNMKPVFIDLDIENSIFVDGSVGVLVYQYSPNQDLFDQQNKLCYFYGNRKLRKNSFMLVAKNVHNATDKKLTKQLKSYNEKGTTQQYTTFSAGVILLFPKFKQKGQDYKLQQEILLQTLTLFQIQHAIIVDKPQISLAIQKSHPKIQRYNTTKLQGTQSFLELPPPFQSKIQRYFDPKLDLNKPITLKSEQIILFEVVEKPNEQLYCRRINVLSEPIVKTTIAVLYAKYQQEMSLNQVALKALSSPIMTLAYIFKKGAKDFILHVAQENFIQDTKDKIWISFIIEDQ